MALTLAIGAVGGTAFYWLRVPLAWMLGAMAFCTLAVLLQAPVRVAPQLREVGITVLGVMLGSSFRPEMLGQFVQWSGTLSALALYLAACGSINMYYLRKVAHYDRTTAFFAAMPGGLAEMMVVGSAAGGDLRKIALTHASRILLVVTAIPFTFRALGYDVPSGPAAASTGGSISLEELVLLAVVGAGGVLVAKVLRLPAAALTGSITASAAVHLAGWSDARPPIELIAAAQIVMGSGAGCRFAGVRLRELGRVFMIAIGATAILLLINGAFAITLHSLLDVPLAAVFLSFAPGGFAEMTVIALALSIDVPFVAIHHMCRIPMVSIVAPQVFHWFERRRARRDQSATGP
jgi:hypothetical protein